MTIRRWAWMVSIACMSSACAIDYSIWTYRHDTTDGGPNGGGGNPFWQELSPMKEARLEHTITTLPDGRVLVTGGFGTGAITNALDSVELWDPQTKQFTLVSPMHQRRARHTATLLGTGKVLVTGGYDATLETNTAEMYDVAADTWTVLGNMTINRMYQAAVELPNGRVLVASGCCNPAYQSAETISPVAPINDKPTPSLMIAHAGPTLTLLLNGQALLVGNANIPTTELYDYMSASWLSTGNLNVPRNQHSANLLSSGRVVVAGGASLGGITNSVESYEPSTGQWTTVLPMLEARYGHTGSLFSAAGLEDIFWAGGTNEAGTILASCERLSGQACGSLNVARSLHRASIVMADGQQHILVTGGADATGKPTNSVEWLAW